MKACLFRAAQQVKKKGGRLILSDLFRSYDMQLGSHKDWATGRKKAFSPPPGGSLHEGGRALDLDLDALKMPLAEFWKIAKDCRLSPIIKTPKAGASESWHFECRGSHTLVYDYYASGKANNFKTPYEAMAASAIVSSGIKHDRFPDREADAYLQSALIRLGGNLGNMDGAIGKRTREALASLEIGGASPAEIALAVEDRLQAAFPEEFFEKVSDPA
jgi:hypothetical protein